MADDPIRVDVPDLGTIEFPAGTSEDAMKRAIDTQLAQSHVAKQQPVPHPVVDRILSWLPTIEGGAGSLLPGGLGIALGGIGAGMGESQRQSINKIVGNPSPAGTPEGEAAIRNAALMGSGGAAVGAAFNPVIKYVGQTLAPAIMQSAVKPAAAQTAKALVRGVSKEDLPVVGTLLKEGVNVSPGGIEKLRRIIGASNREIADTVKNMSGSISPSSVVQRLKPVMQAASNQVNPMADRAAVRDVGNEFLQTWQKTASGQVKPPLTPTQAQAIKVGTYRNLGNKAYGELKSTSVEAQKALARGLKEELEAEAAKSGVDLSALNLREGNAIQAAEAVAKRLAVKGNHDPLGIAWLSENPQAALAFALSRSPAVKSMIANGMYRSAAVASKLPEAFIKGAVTALATSPDTEEGQ